MYVFKYFSKLRLIKILVICKKKIDVSKFDRLKNDHLAIDGNLMQEEETEDPGARHQELLGHDQEAERKEGRGGRSGHSISSLRTGRPKIAGKNCYAIFPLKRLRVYPQ